MNKLLTLLIGCFLATGSLSAQDWAKIITDVRSNQPNKIRSLPNGDFILGGVSYNPGLSGSCGFLMRTDAAGNVIWQKQVGSIDGQGNFKNYERFEDVILSTDGFIIAVGNQELPVTNSAPLSNLFISKFDLNGTEIWRKYVDYRTVDHAFGVAALPFGEFVVCGNTTNSVYNKGDGLILKMGPDSIVQWVQYYDRASTDDVLQEVIVTSDQHLMAVGTSGFPSGGRVLVVHTDLDGNQDWLNTYPEYSLIGNSIVESNNGHFGICGRSFTSGFSFDNLIMEIDATGAEVWNKHLHANANLPDELYDLIPCAEGGYVSVGQSGENASDGYHILRVDADGEVLTALHLYDGGQNLEAARSLTWASEGSLMVTGLRHSPGGTCGHDDLILTSLSDLGCAQLRSATTELPSIELQITPNPATDFITLNAPGMEGTAYDFSILDATGKLVSHFVSDKSSVQIDCRAFPSGAYCYALLLQNGQTSKDKFLIAR